MTNSHEEPTCESSANQRNPVAKSALHAVHSPASSDEQPATHTVSRSGGDTTGDSASESPLAGRRDTYKETIAMVKDTLDVAWKVAPVALLPAAMFIWIYLRSIHWTALFQDSAMSGSGLIFLFIVAMLISFAVLLQFIAPSLFVIGALSGYRNERTLPKVVPRLFHWATGGWLAGFALIVELDSGQVWIMFAMAFAAAFVFGIRRRRSLDIPQKAEGKLSLPAVHAAALALAAVGALAATSMPLLITLHIAARYANGGWLETLLVFAVCLGTTAVSLLPGYMYLNARTWRPGFYQPLKLALLGGFFLSYIVMAGAALFVPVSSTVVCLAGIYSNEPQGFEVLQPSLAVALDAAGVPVRRGAEITIVTGYVRYNFGGVRLLCRAPFDPSLVSADAVKLARKKKAPDPTVLAGSGCVQATSSELRPLRL